MSDIDTAVVDSLKVLDPERPIREADNQGSRSGNRLSVFDPTATLQCEIAALAGYVMQRRQKLKGLFQS